MLMGNPHNHNMNTTLLTFIKTNKRNAVQWPSHSPDLNATERCISLTKDEDKTLQKHAETKDSCGKGLTKPLQG